MKSKSRKKRPGKPARSSRSSRGQRMKERMAEPLKREIAQARQEFAQEDERRPAPAPQEKRDS